MLEKFKYINHVGEVLEFGKAPLFVNENDLRNFSWVVDTMNDKISGFSKGIVSKTIPIIIKCNSKAEGLAMRDHLFEVFEKDIIAKQYGRIVVGEYYLRCFVTDSSKSGYLTSAEYMELELVIQTDLPNWAREITTRFLTTTKDEGFLDFPYDFSYDLKNGMALGEIFNSGIISTDFRIDIYGTVVNPVIFIGGHEYSVNTEVASGEVLTIDSVEKTITLTKVNGKKVNCFMHRNRNSYIFQKIPSGVSTVTTGAVDFSFAVTLLEDRSEPRWI